MYRAISVSMTWDKAQEHCKGLGGNLVKIRSAEENEFVLNMVSKIAPSHQVSTISYGVITRSQSTRTGLQKNRMVTAQNHAAPCTLAVDSAVTGMTTDAGFGPVVLSARDCPR